MATQDLYYYESGYLTPELGYYTYVADAESIQTSTSTLTVVVGKIVEAESTITSTSTITATVSNQRGADLFAFTNATLAIEVQRLRDNNIDASSAFNVATDATRTRYISASEDAAFDISVDSLRVRYNEAAVDAAFSLAASSEYYRGTPVDLELTASLTAVGTFPVSTTCQLYSQASLDASLNINHEGAATVASQVTVTANLGIIKQAVIACDSLFTPAVVCNAIVNNGVDASVVSSLVIQPTFSFAIPADITASTSLALEINKIQQGASNSSSSFTQETNNLRVRYQTSSLASEFSQDAQVNRTTGSATANLSLAFSQDTVNTRTRDVPSSLSAVFAQTTVNERTRDNLVASSSEFTEQAAPNASFSANANFTAFYSEIVAYLKYAGVDSHISVVATMSVVTSRTKQFASTISSQAQQTCQATYPVYYTASLASAFSLDLIKTYGLNQLNYVDGYYTSPEYLVVDDDKNAYQLVLRTNNINNNKDYILIKSNKSGTILWQQLVKTTTSYLDSRCLAVDANQNVYLVLGDNVLTKFDTSGSVVWAKTLVYGTGTIRTLVNDQIIVDNSNNIWLASYTRVISTGNISYDSILTKLNSSGTVIFTNSYDGKNNNDGILPFAKTANSIIYSTKQIGTNNGFKVTVDTYPNTYPTSGTISRLVREVGTYYNYNQYPKYDVEKVLRDNAGNYYFIVNNEANGPVAIEKISSTGVSQYFKEFDWAIGPSTLYNSWGWTEDTYVDSYIDNLGRIGVIYNKTIFPSGSSSGGFYVRAEFLYWNPTNLKIENQFYIKHNDSYVTKRFESNHLVTNADQEIFISGDSISTKGAAWTYLPPGGQGFNSNISPGGWEYQALAFADSSWSNKTRYGTIVVSTRTDSNEGTVTSTTATVSYTTTSLTNENSPFNINSFDVIRNTVNLVAFITADIDTRVIARGNATVSSAFDETATTTRIRDFNATINTAQAQLYLSPYDFRKAEANLTAQATVLANPYDYTKATANLTAQATLSINAEVGIIGELFAFTNAALTLVPRVTRTVDAQIDCQTALTANVQRTKFASLVAFSNASLTTTISRTRTTSAAATTTSQLTCSFTVVKVGFSTEPVVASLSCTAISVRTVRSNLVSQASLTIIAGKLVGVTANLQAFNTVLSVGKILSLDPYYQLKIEGASGELWIIPETRLLEVQVEARGLIVRQESRLLTINQETRVNIIKGYPS